MDQSEAFPLDPADWRPRPQPPHAAIAGRWARLEPLSASRHGPQLWSALSGRDEVWTYLPYGPFADEASFSAWLRGREDASDPLTFAIVKDDESLGLLSLMQIRPDFGVIEIGHVLFSPALQRSPAASEAIYLAARLVFDRLGYRRLEWKCNARNETSRRAALRFGFAFEGVFKQHMIVKGRNRDTAWYALLDGEWSTARAAFERWLAPDNFNEQGFQRAALADLRR